MRRFIRWLVGVAIVQALVLLFLAWLLPGFSLGEFRRAVPSALLISAVLALAWPFIYTIAGRFHPALFPVLTFVLTGFVIYLVGQVNVEGFRGEVIAGVGGHPDYAGAAIRSRDGLSVVALPTVRGGRRTLVERLSAPASTSRSDVDVVVTELGTADLRGLSDAERARALLTAWGE